MRFLVDAQLPRRLCHQLRECGHDAVHSLDLPSGNRTSDAEIMRIADTEDRVVVTKDDDFVQSFLLRNQPRRLLLIATGNIGNAEVSQLIAAALPALVEAFGTARYLELSHNAMIIHE
jgi:predicted nuclease of predicted toxin-antitoxin system